MSLQVLSSFAVVAQSFLCADRSVYVQQLYLCRSIYVQLYPSEAIIPFASVSRSGYDFEMITRVASDGVICLQDLTRCYPALIYRRLFQRTRSFCRLIELC